MSLCTSQTRRIRSERRTTLDGGAPPHWSVRICQRADQVYLIKPPKPRLRITI
ncbi:hypothetical protein GALMADRAFT_717502 [Galerina marginata CBS 339.88]|uniref:Uncharacterized protein n=1 Tax=Galerina marginata (strain CBS 339.88) TaxID=685588 RepID=A0A067TQG3_GALM3|nr:hypothetical protein GALMADRAFT_717502 [Galerina marginata CBS 339.88]